MSPLAGKLLEVLAELARADTTALGAVATTWLRFVADERRQIKRFKAARDRGSLDLARQLGRFVEQVRERRIEAERELIAELARSSEVTS